MSATTKDKLEFYGAPLGDDNICPVCFRDYNGHVQEDGIKFCTSDDCPSHPDYVEEADNAND